MERTERWYRIHELLSGAGERPVPFARLRDYVGGDISRATLMRDLRHMRLYLGAPIVFRRGAVGGYSYDRAARRFELPGFWLGPDDARALLLIGKLLDDLQPGLLGPVVDPLRKRLARALGDLRVDAAALHERVSARPLASRACDARVFRAVADACLRQRTLNFRYHARERDEDRERIVDPQRLVLHRDNWYLIGYCRERLDLRVFALDRMRDVSTLGGPVTRVDAATIDARLAASFGVVLGDGDHRALLRFTPARARWVADEVWHPAQQGRWCDDGAYELVVPYSNPSELLLEIFRHGDAVEVIAPAALRIAVATTLARAAAQY